LKFKVVDHEHDRREEDHEWCPEDTKYDYHWHMALAVRSFWEKKARTLPTRSKHQGIY
jgi:hypothetical protein